MVKWGSPVGSAIHNIDVVTWFMEDRPIRAVGFGGRAQRLTGDIYDFFSVDYYYNNNKTHVGDCSSDRPVVTEMFPSRYMEPRGWPL